MADRIEKVILSRYLYIGDRIAMEASDESRSYNTDSVKGIPDGTQGTVVGFYRYKQAYGPDERYLLKGPNMGIPGIYEGNGATYVLWDNGIANRPSLHDVVFVDKALNEIRRKDSEYHKAFEVMVKISDLPKLPYMIGNIVLLKPGTISFGENGRYVRINRIDYLKAKDFCNDGVTPFPIYGICPADATGPSTSVRADDIERLINPGNYWRWENDQRDKLVFKDLQEEAGFYSSLGFSEQLRNPATDNYRWTLEEAVDVIEAGNADVIKDSGSWFGSTPFPTLYKYHDLPDLSRRLREETLKGFNRI